MDRSTLVRPVSARRSWIALPAIGRTGVFSPGAATPFGSAVDAPGGPRPGPRGKPSSRLRRTLGLSNVEGILAEIVAACAGGAVLTGWALSLGGSAALVAAIGALPFLAQIFQFPAAFLGARFGRRTVAVVAVTVQRQAVLPLALLPLFDPTPAVARAILVVVAMIYAAFGVVANNAWTAWMGDLVPRTIRGRYFGGRTARCTFAGSLAALVAGIALDRARALDRATTGLALLALVASIAGAVTTFLLLAHQPDPQPDPRDADLPDPRPFVAPFVDPRVRPFLAYHVAWNAAVGIAAGLFTLHMLRDLGLGFGLIAAHGVATAFVRLVAAPRWGRLVDRGGEGSVLVVCSFGVAILPLFWALPARFWVLPLILDPIVSGIVWSGHSVAAFSLPLSLAQARTRGFYLAAFATAGGVAFAIGAALGGVIVVRTPSIFGLPGIQVAFVASALARLAAATLALRLDRERVDALGWSRAWRTAAPRISARRADAAVRSP
jgi:MFS family permease